MAGGGLLKLNRVKMQIIEDHAFEQQSAIKYKRKKGVYIQNLVNYKHLNIKINVKYVTVRIICTEDRRKSSFIRNAAITSPHFSGNFGTDRAT